MGQQEVIKILESENDWLTTTQITSRIKLETTRNAIRSSLNKLHKYGEVDKKPSVMKYRTGGDNWRFKKDV